MSSTFNPKNILILRYRTRKIAIPRDQCQNLEGLKSFAVLNFGSLQEIPVEDVVVAATIPGHPDTEPVEIFPTLWPTMSRVVDNVTIMLVSERDRSSSPVCKSSNSPAPPQKAHSSTLLPNLPTSLSPQRPPSSLQACQNPLNAPQKSLPLPVGLPRLQNHGSTATTSSQTIKVKFISQSFTHPAPPPFSINEDGLLGQKVSHLYKRIGTRIFDDVVIKDLQIECLSLDKERSLSSYAMHSGSTVTAILTMKRRPVWKPVIYLYPPSSLADVTVKLTLVPSWFFSAAHPSQRTMLYLGGHRVQSWNVSAEPNGTLVDKATGMEVSYLYWEANMKVNLTTITPPSTNTMENADSEMFDPLEPSVDPGNSVLLSKSKLPGYLDVALEALTLHPEARTSFISYWLQNMQNSEHIALRFVTQESYDKAVEMHITPAPDIVTRVFMLFHRVETSDLSRWEPARARAAEEDGATFWADVVGVDAEFAADRRLFRVLEWGGMEVY